MTFLLKRSYDEKYGLISDPIVIHQEIKSLHNPFLKSYNQVQLQIPLYWLHKGEWDFKWVTYDGEGKKYKTNNLLKGKTPVVRLVLCDLEMVEKV